MEFINLNNGVKMPKIGFGVFQIEDEECERCVIDALNVGYRMIDTAQAYYNEGSVGSGIKKSGIKREDIFLTTKVWVTNFGYEKTKNSVFESMKNLQTDYLDLVLIHQCLGDYYGAYRALEEMYEEGLIKAIGISNFSAERMVDLLTFNKITPAVNQVETHLFYQQNYLHEWMNKYNVKHEAWGPLAQHRAVDIINNPVIKQIAKKYGKTETQVVLKFLLQNNRIVIPKTTNVSRMKENISIFDFTLSHEDETILSSFDENKSLWISYDDPNVVELAMS